MFGKGRRDYRMPPKWTIPTARDVILTSRTDVREMVDDDDDDEWPLVLYIYIQNSKCCATHPVAVQNIQQL